MKLLLAKAIASAIASARNNRHDTPAAELGGVGALMS
jgi:hypothetical protein